MERRTKHLIVISFDGLSTKDFDYIKTLPHFGTFIKEASYSKKVYSVYPSLTYPAHATIVTGKYPKSHGIINNTILQPNRDSPDWYWHRRDIRGETLYDLAIDQGMKVAALLWPVTAKSRIQYNMPEILANRPWLNQILVSLLNGSPIYQYRMNQKFGQLRKGIQQPYLDDFTHQSLLYTLQNKKPDLTLVHYTDLDTIRHHHGYHSQEAQQALKRHDKRLGEIINTLKENHMYEESTVVLLGDHSSLDEDKIINLNILLRQQGYIQVNSRGKIRDYQVILKNCDGSAYLYVKDPMDQKLIAKISSLIEEFNRIHHCIESIYTREEAMALGADPTCALMLEANQGYYFLDDIEGEVIREIKAGEAGRIPHVTKSTHGYSPFKEDYTTVFMALGKGVKKGVVVEEMHLIDEGPTLAKMLGITLKDADGRIVEEFFA